MTGEAVPAEPFLSLTVIPTLCTSARDKASESVAKT
jgi:hypothetical protein